MDLLAYQRSFMRMSFAAQPDAEDLASVGSREAALMYRHMIRTRLVGMAKVAFKASLAALGEDVFAASFARYLAEAPPHSALIRDVIADFGPFARADRELAASGPAFLADLLQFEEETWRLAYLLGPETDRARLRELDFERAPLWNPVFRVLSLAHPVHSLFGSRAEARASTFGSRAEARASTFGSRAEARASTVGELAPEACELLMYRPPGSDEVRWYKADAFFAALVRRSQQSPARSFGELVKVVAEEGGVAVDQALIETLATSLTLAVERGVLLGVLDGC